MNAPTACFMFAHKTKGEHGLPPSRTESEALVCIGQYLAQSKSRECHNFGYIKLSTRTGCEALAIHRAILVESKSRE